MTQHLLELDIETYSSVDLKTRGVYRYAASPDFLILFCWWSYDDGPIMLALGEDQIRAIPGLTDPDTLKVAHNAQFERVCFSSFFDLGTGNYLPIEEWEDTQAIAAEHGLPQKLEYLAPVFGVQKDEAGTRLINIFCKPRSTGKLKGTRCLPEEKPEEWERFLEYGRQDVVAQKVVRRELHALGGWPTEMEEKIFFADQRINDDGIYIDTELARHGEAMAKKNQDAQKFQLSEACNWVIENPNSNPQWAVWREQQGLDVDNMKKETVEALLEGDLTAEQREVLELRQELALVASKKYSSALNSVLPDGRLRGTLKFFGAHTARWSGRGTQVQNLPSQSIELQPDDQFEIDLMYDLGMDKKLVEAREAFLIEAETERAIRRLMHGHETDAQLLKALVRPMFQGPLTVVDYSAIEARVLAWWCGELWAMEAFRAGRDIYVETADRMSTPDRPLGRKQGKVAVLALGYNGAVNSLRAMGAEGTDEELMVLVKQWRRANAKIVGMWQELGDAFGQPGKVGEYLRTTESSDALGRSVHIHLPSGRSIGYHGVLWENYKVKHPTIPNRWVSKTGWRYADPKDPWNKNMRIGTYGGRLAENVTQAIARDIMAEALVRLHDAGYTVVGHVHDEILVEGEHPVEEISRIMTQPPSWATDMPIDGEGFVCARYRKG